MSFLSKIFGDANERTITSFQPTVVRVNALEAEYQKLSDQELAGKTLEFRDRLAKSVTLDDILPEAFAAVREASRRVSGKRHFDVQLTGGVVLHQGNIAEMRTGEGKTLVATLPAYLNALEGKGVHIVTVNDFLARRDVVWMGQIYDALGVTVGVINHDSSFRYDPTHQEKGDPHDISRDVEGGFRVVHEFLRPVSRRDAYAADITYGTNNEFGFDYLRDNMVYRQEQMVQRGHHFAVVDEVDSILIDEARTPLIISAPDEESTKLYEMFARAVPVLQEIQDYTIDHKLKTVSITESGIEKMEKRLGLKNIYDEGGVRYVHHLEQALRAQVLFKRDRDYVVRENEVMIVDEFTGRLMPGRRWSDGLHQAVEAKEGVHVQKESRTLATITFQNYFRLYKKLSGMTGTARTSAEEFHKVYNLDTVTVPTHRPMIRQDTPDRIYKTEQGKFRAIAREIRSRHEKGQPMLVGTVSIEKNELLSALLTNEGVPHNMLNAKNHEKEAEIIAQAGRRGAVTVATNLAGRGVDIILGGNPPDESEATTVKDLGGLHVIGTERHEARRIDDQLRGRSGRQGDPGSSQFFVSTEDELVRTFGGDRLKNVMERLGVGEDDVIENSFISRAIQQAQSRIEGHNFDIRKYVLEYDDVMNRHREAIYRLRRNALASNNPKEDILEYLDAQIHLLVQFHTSQETDDRTALIEGLKNLAPFSQETLGKLSSLHDSEEIIAHFQRAVRELYDGKEFQAGADQMRRLERTVILRTVDEFWMDHLDEMERLRDSVRLRAYGQRDPLVEYKIEAQHLFERLDGVIKSQIAHLIFKVSMTSQPQAASPKLQVTNESSDLEHESLKHEAGGKTPGRNDPCWCGSGKKYKKCHGK